MYELTVTLLSTVYVKTTKKCRLKPHSAWTVTPLVNQTVGEMALGTAFDNLITMHNLPPYISAGPAVFLHRIFYTASFGAGRVFRSFSRRCICLSFITHLRAVLRQDSNYYGSTRTPQTSANRNVNQGTLEPDCHQNMFLGSSPILIDF